ncbi:hypothetical protein AXM55_23880 [Salmonella enterica subsp. enterica]|nr:hypothetical protein [Salmonella enterica subsp. enterica]MIQ75179.1 hypothetical protein [Salmonella enterica subsp. enterica]
MSFEFRCSYLVKDSDLKDYIVEKKIDKMPAINVEYQKKVIEFVCSKNNSIWDYDDCFIKNSIKENGLSAFEEKFLLAFIEVKEIKEKELFIETYIKHIKD